MSWMKRVKTAIWRRLFIQERIDEFLGRPCPLDRQGHERCRGYRMEDFVKCETCGGTGGEAPDWCPKCGGEGEYPKFVLEETQ